MAAVEIVERLGRIEIQTPASSVDIETGILGGNPYEGAYSVTPSASEQVLETAGRILAQNVTISPIPSNYGLITWDGAILTVS